MALLEVKGLSLDLKTDGEMRRLVDRLSLTVAAGEVVGLIGESGCGKSVSALALTRLLDPDVFRFVEGQVLLQDRDVLRMDEDALRGVRGRVVSYVFQDPVAYLNPILTVGAQIEEMLVLHHPDKAKKKRIVELLELVGIPSPDQRINDYPHQLSGGMLQRVMIAMALASEPALLVADEPTTALDVTIQAQVIELLATLREELGMAILLISHNLGLVDDFADRVTVMYAGQAVETGTTASVIGDPKHPYTQALIRAIPRLGEASERLPTIPGQVPLAGRFPAGCRFHPRCSLAVDSCQSVAPELQSLSGNRRVRCPLTSGK